MFQDPAPEKILYCYGIYQPLFDDIKQNIPHLIFHQGLPDKEEMEQFAGHTLLVLDDLMSDVSTSKHMQDLFCQNCHHMGIKVMYLTQNTFFRMKHRIKMVLIPEEKYNPVLPLKTRSQTCVGGISQLNLVNWTLDMKN